MIGLDYQFGVFENYPCLDLHPNLRFSSLLTSLSETGPNIVYRREQQLRCEISRRSSDIDPARRPAPAEVYAVLLASPAVR